MNQIEDTFEEENRALSIWFVFDDIQGFLRFGPDSVLINDILFNRGGKYANTNNS